MFIRITLKTLSAGLCWGQSWSVRVRTHLGARPALNATIGVMQAINGDGDGSLAQSAADREDGTGAGCHSGPTSDGQAAVQLFFRLNHARQTVDFVDRQVCRPASGRRAPTCDINGFCVFIANVLRCGCLSDVGPLWQLLPVLRPAAACQASLCFVAAGHMSPAQVLPHMLSWQCVH